MNPAALKATICAVIALGAFGGGYSLCKLQWGADVSEREKNITAERLAIAQDTLAAQLANGKLLNEVGVENERNRILVADLNRRLVFSRVRLPADLCADYDQADPTPANETASTAGGVLPTPVGGGLERVQQAIEWYGAKTKERAVENEGVMFICRPVNEWARNQ